VVCFSMGVSIGGIVIVACFCVVCCGCPDKIMRKRNEYVLVDIVQKGNENAKRRGKRYRRQFCAIVKQYTISHLWMSHKARRVRLSSL
jgi:hypothetical protein